MITGTQGLALTVAATNLPQTLGKRAERFERSADRASDRERWRVDSGAAIGGNAADVLI